MSAEQDVAAVSEAAAAAVSEVSDLTDSQHLQEISDLQLLILGRLQDSNAVLSSFNDFSARSFAAVANDFARNTRMLRSMRSELDNIFRRIRVLKEKLRRHNPQAFDAIDPESLRDERPDLEEEVQTGTWQEAGQLDLKEEVYNGTQEEAGDQSLAHKTETHAA